MGASHEATFRQYPLLNLCDMRSTSSVVVVCHGMVGHRFVEALRSRDADGAWRVTVLAEEADAAYDRVGLTGYTEHWDRGLLALPGNDYRGDDFVELRLGGRVTEIDRAAKTVLTADGARIDYDAQLKLLGVDVASFGDAMGTTPDCLEVVVNDAVNQIYAKLVLSDDAKTLLGGILVGDASVYGVLRPMVGEPLPGDPLALISPAGPEGGAGGAGLGIGALPASAQMLVQQRHQGRPVRGDCRRLQRCPRAEELHVGRYVLRLVRAAAQAAAGGRGRRTVPRTVRTLQPVARRAVLDHLRWAC
jgi:hypothetical protein